MYSMHHGSEFDFFACDLMNCVLTLYFVSFKNEIFLHLLLIWKQNGHMARDHIQFITKQWNTIYSMHAYSDSALSSLRGGGGGTVIGFNGISNSCSAICDEIDVECFVFQNVTFSCLALLLLEWSSGH